MSEGLHIAMPASSKPEYVRPADMRGLFGIGRTAAYALMKAGEIKYKTTRKRGHVKGTRLVNYDSIMEYIDALPDEDEQD